MRSAFYLSVILLLASCQQKKIQDAQSKSILKHHERDIVAAKSGSDSRAAKETRERDLRKLAMLKAIKGYRFVVQGNFDGLCGREVLTEHICSALLHEETNKFYEGLPYDEYPYVNELKENYSFVSCDHKDVDTLKCSGGLGLLLLKNEGDLNGDGTDEITMVVNNADYNNANHCDLMTYKDGKWRTLYSFGIWDWQVPMLPDNMPDTTGQLTAKDSANWLRAKQLSAFSFIKKIEKNKIQVTCRVEDSEETKIVVLPGE